MTLRARLELLKAELHRDDYKAVVDAVIACPERGDVLPLSQQPGGCAACERFECKAGRGLPEMPGISDQTRCITCCCEKLGVTT